MIIIRNAGILEKYTMYPITLGTWMCCHFRWLQAIENEEKQKSHLLVFVV